MANTNLTIDQITYEALTVLHANMNFVGSINRQYDNRFALGGAKIGDSLRIRKPVQYTVLEDNPSISGAIQDSTETSVSLTIDKRATIAMQFSSEELALDIDDFSGRYIKPAMSVMASNIEGRFINDMVKTVPNTVGDATTVMTWGDIQSARQIMVEALTPTDNQWCICMDPKGNTQLTDATKALFNNQELIGEQYRKGLIAETAGFKFYENTLINAHLTGTRAVDDYLVNAPVTPPADGDTTLVIDGGTGGSTTIKIGDIFTLEKSDGTPVNRVHPETKADTGELMEFIATTDITGTGGTLGIYPAMYESGPFQNITELPDDDAQITFVTSPLVDDTTGRAYPLSLAFHKDCFTFATVDLQMPEGVHMASRQVMDGISMRIVSDYDITEDLFVSRIDVLYGYKELRPELACRIAHL
jgi:hypothetical protein